MQAVATTEAVWVPVRCPCRLSVLLDVMGTADGTIRRRCQRCGNWWIIDLATGRVTGAPQPGRPGLSYRASA